MTNKNIRAFVTGLMEGRRENLESFIMMCFIAAAVIAVITTSLFIYYK